MRNTKGQTVPKKGSPAEHMAACPECLEMVAKHMGTAHKADGMKSQDQSGPEKVSAGKDKTR